MDQWDKAKYETMLSSLGEGIVFIDDKGEIELINRQAELLLGRSMTEVLGKKWDEIAPLVDEKGNRIEPEYRATSIVIKTGKPRSNKSNYYVRRDGTKFAVGTTAAPVVFDGKVVGVIAVFRDITREKEIDKAKTEFVTLASHQLRTPLSAIKWFTEMLLNGDAGELSAEQREFLINISLSSKRMTDLVDSLLNISRIESGRIIVEPVPTDLGKLVHDVVKDLEVSVKEKGIELAISVYPDLGSINIDPKLISQVYQNLLTNAIKYTQNGGKILVVISRKENEVVSQITDSGLGVPGNEQHRIFEKFYRGSNVVKLETNGNGLGLYLVKAIVDSSQGRIWFESEVGRGTTFWFSLPVSGMLAREGEVRLN